MVGKTTRDVIKLQKQSIKYGEGNYIMRNKKLKNACVIGKFDSWEDIF